jgi:hypothetical protein
MAWILANLQLLKHPATRENQGLMATHAFHFRIVVLTVSMIAVFGRLNLHFH